LAFQIAPFPMILTDLRSHSLIVTIFKLDFCAFVQYWTERRAVPR